MPAIRSVSGDAGAAMEAEADSRLGGLRRVVSVDDALVSVVSPQHAAAKTPQPAAAGVPTDAAAHVPVPNTRPNSRSAAPVEPQRDPTHAAALVGGYTLAGSLSSHQSANTVKRAATEESFAPASADHQHEVRAAAVNTTAASGSGQPAGAQLQLAAAMQVEIAKLRAENAKLKAGLPTTTTTTTTATTDPTDPFEPAATALVGTPIEPVYGTHTTVQLDVTLQTSPPGASYAAADAYEHAGVPVAAVDYAQPKGGDDGGDDGDDNGCPVYEAIDGVAVGAVEPVAYPAAPAPAPAAGTASGRVADGVMDGGVDGVIDEAGCPLYAVLMAEPAWHAEPDETEYEPTYASATAGDTLTRTADNVYEYQECAGTTATTKATDTDTATDQTPDHRTSDKTSDMTSKPHAGTGWAILTTGIDQSNLTTVGILRAPGARASTTSSLALSVARIKQRYSFPESLMGTMAVAAASLSQPGSQPMTPSATTAGIEAPQMPVDSRVNSHCTSPLPHALTICAVDDQDTACRSTTEDRTAPRNTAEVLSAVSAQLQSIGPTTATFMPTPPPSVPLPDSNRSGSTASSNNICSYSQTENLSVCLSAGPPPAESQDGDDVSFVSDLDSDLE